MLSFLIMAIVFVVYFGTATKWTFHPPWTIDYINPMAKALLQGRLDIPDPAMTYDLAFYNGRWYMTWGILAAIVHIPLQLIVGGRYVPALYTSLLFGTLTVGVVWSMLLRIRDEWFSSASLWSCIVFVSMYAFGTMQYYMSTLGSIWHVNQVVSTFFGVAGVAVILKKKRTVWKYMTSSAFLGIALFGRPTVALLFIIPIVLLINDIKQKRSFNMQLYQLIIGVCLPIFISLVFVGIYNKVRFGNPVDTGHKYLKEAIELAVKRERFGMLSLRYIPVNAWHMLVAPPKFAWNNRPTMQIDLNGNSIFFLSPLLIYFFGTLLFMRSKKRELILIIRALWMGIILTAVLSLLYYNTGWMQFGYRYALDFSFLLIILTYIWFNGKVYFWMVIPFVYTVWVNYAGILQLQ